MLVCKYSNKPPPTVASLMGRKLANRILIGGFTVVLTISMNSEAPQYPQARVSVYVMDGAGFLPAFEGGIIVTPIGGGNYYFKDFL